jgi:hypothetical protein
MLNDYGVKNSGRLDIKQMLDDEDFGENINATNSATGQEFVKQQKLEIKEM